MGERDWRHTGWGPGDSRRGRRFHPHPGSLSPVKTAVGGTSSSQQAASSQQQAASSKQPGVRDPTPPPPPPSPTHKPRLPSPTSAEEGTNTFTQQQQQHPAEKRKGHVERVWSQGRDGAVLPLLGGLQGVPGELCFVRGRGRGSWAWAWACVCCSLARASWTVWRAQCPGEGLAGGCAARAEGGGGNGGGTAHRPGTDRDRLSPLSSLPSPPPPQSGLEAVSRVHPPPPPPSFASFPHPLTVSLLSPPNATPHPFLQNDPRRNRRPQVPGRSASPRGRTTSSACTTGRSTPW